MAQTWEAATRSKAKKREAKKREKPLGVAVALGLAASLAVAVLIVVAQLLDPHSALHNFYTLVRYQSSATLPLDPLYQKWYGEVAEEDVLFGSTFTLFCGGLVIGWLAPSYETRRRVLLAAAGLGLGLPLVFLAFQWSVGIFEQNTLNTHEGGQQVGLAAPLSLILAQAVCVVLWTAFCVLGAWTGFWLRRRNHTVLGA